MPLDLARLFESSRGCSHQLAIDHVNPVWARVLKTIGFDKEYVRAQGQYLWDTEGKRYLDMLGGYALANVGRNHPAVAGALKQCIDSECASLVQFDTPLLAGVLARELKQRVGRELDRVFFTNSGAEGIECAIKFARCATGRPAILYATGAFHGLTTGALAINGCESFREGFEPLDRENCRAVAWGDLAALERALHIGDVAAFVVEPIQGKGVHIPATGYLAEASRLCRRHGALFVADEIQTGVFRTGTFLAIDQEGDVRPDIVVMSKALSGGFIPVGAVLSTRSVWEEVFSRMDRAIVHSSTFHMSALAMTAGLATLSVCDEEHLGQRARSLGGELRDGLAAMQPRFEYIKEVRQRGLMIGIEFARGRSLSLGLAWDMVQAMDRNLFVQGVTIPLMAEHRIITQVAGHAIPVLKLTPPLVITKEDVTHFLQAFEETMTAIHRFPGPAWDVLRRVAGNSVRRRPAAPEMAPLR